MHYSPPVIDVPQPPQGVVWFVRNAANGEDRMLHIHDECEALLTLAAQEERSLTPAEQERFDSLSNEFTALSMAEKMRPTGRKTSPDGPTRRDAVAQSEALSPSTIRALQRQPFKGRTQAELFGPVRQNSPFHSVDEFFSIVVNNQFDPRMIRAAAMSEGEMSAGGYLVPVEYSAQMLDAALEQSALFSRVLVQPMTTREKLVGTFDSSDNSGGAPYGLTLQWVSEGGTFSESKAKTRQIHLVSHKTGVLVPYSHELSEDSADFVTLLQGACSAALAWGIDDAILNGSGAGQPLGILNSNALISVAKETGQLADTIQFENIVAMYAKMHPASIANAIWLANPSSLPQLLEMGVPLGTGGQWTPVLTNQAGVYSLLGRPLYLTEKCPALGNKGDIVFVDPSQYVVGLRRNLEVALDPYSKFASDEIQLRVTTRIAGQPVVGNAFTMKNGGTVAPFVTLDERA